MNLRPSLPDFDTYTLARQWMERVGVLRDLDQLSVDCAMSLGQRRILFQTIRAMEARQVLDIGTYVGSSALAFALAVENGGGRVVSVDIQPDHWQLVGRPRSPRQLMTDADVIRDTVEFVTMDARAYLRSTDRRFDLICIDGWHEDFAVEEEVDLALRHLRPGGLIYVDDVQVEGGAIPAGMDRIDGPRIALQRMVAGGYPFRVLPLTQTLEGDWCAGAFLVAAA